MSQANSPATAGLTMSLANVVASAGTTSTLTTTTTSAGIINGKYVTTYAAANNAATPTLDAFTGKAFVQLVDPQTCTVVFGQNAAGTLKMVQGPAIAIGPGVTTTAGAFLTQPQFPELPDDFMPFAYTVVRTSPTGSTFTPGTTGWAASGITSSTFQNVAVLPDRPQTA